MKRYTLYASPGSGDGSGGTGGEGRRKGAVAMSCVIVTLPRPALGAAFRRVFFLGRRDVVTPELAEDFDLW